jgi:hypothetical protein
MPHSINLVEYEHTPACLRGLPAELYFRTKRFLLAAQGLFSQCVNIRAFHHSPALCTRQTTATRPFKAFSLFDCPFCSSSPAFGQIKTPSILPKDEEQSKISRATTFIRQCLTASTSSSTNILQPGYGGFRQRSTFAQCDFLSQLRVFFHSVPTYGLSTTRPLSARDKQPLLVPSKLFPYSVVIVTVIL